MRCLSPTPPRSSDYRGVKKNDNVYSGFMECGDCGSPMFATSRSDMKPAYTCGTVEMAAYENGWFVRLSVVDKPVSKVIGTIELCLRVSKDAFDNMGILRVDVRSDYENESVLLEIFSLITPHMSDLLGCKGVITKAPIYAVERISAILKAGFTKSEDYLIDGTTAMPMMDTGNGDNFVPKNYK